MRIGFGYDVHRLEEGYNLFIGGVKIISTKGAVGHSDADVLLHSICDALLGAAALRDIGFHFPDTDAKYKNIDSKILLSEVYNLIFAKGYKVANIDSTVCLQSPKIANYIPEMQKIIANILNIKEDAVSVKATTTERLGFVGDEKGISAYSVCLIVF
ncbi:MAG: 2-C-methyl-D-erythritol 2,4-cyclodiphosphate synthase [Bacteroidales bacterium]|nr:2-C-methyl-D-erythritol 2,4-cyclodiphosphate synthase [Bacteroidales bacterium]